MDLNLSCSREAGVLQYSHEELKRLIDIHINDPVAQAESGLTMSDGQLIMGAFDYKRKRSADRPGHLLCTMQDAFEINIAGNLAGNVFGKQTHTWRLWPTS